METDLNQIEDEQVDLQEIDKEVEEVISEYTEEEVKNAQELLKKVNDEKNAKDKKFLEEYKSLCEKHGKKFFHFIASESDGMRAEIRLVSQVIDIPKENDGK